MPLDALFSFASLLAAIGWLTLLTSPWTPVWSQRIAGLAVPALIALPYLALMLVSFAAAPGGFSSLDGVAQLFSSRPVLLAGWLHYLAFDLLVGAWAVRDARRRGLRFAWVVPCLAATFLFGPAGFLLYLAIRTTVPGQPAATARAA
ncbi:DUF4281 domain-containing protein [Xylophilus sp. Kf1]|nr:DUF4281 domain-containing protein [Xylophilus sp. Kf1]